MAERDIPKYYQGIYRRAMSGKSRKAAVHAFCLECVGWERNEIALCTDRECPLYPYRPYKRIKVDKSSAIIGGV